MNFDVIVKKEGLFLCMIPVDIILEIQEMRLKKNLEVDFSNSIEFQKFFNYLESRLEGKEWRITTPLAERLAQYIVILNREKLLIPVLNSHKIVTGYQLIK